MMDSQARRALATIRKCLAQGRYLVSRHFAQRMDQRGLFWPDVRAVIGKPTQMEAGGEDDLGRPKWLIAGKTTDGLELEVVCVLDRDEQGRLVVFITAYWQES